MVSRSRSVKAQRYLCLMVAVLCTCLAWDTYALSAREKVIVGWIEAPPFYRAQASGQPTGFAAQVMLRIAEHAKFDVEFKQYDNAENLFAAVRSGESHVMPAARASSFPEPGFVFSAPVGKAELVVVERADSATNSLDQIIDRQIGFFLRENTPQARQLLDRNNAIEFPLSGDAIIKLLAGDVDALIASDAWIAGQLRAAKLDHRVRRISTPLERSDRVVALHPSRAHLLKAVNVAIADLDASGELAELQTIWALQLPIPAPKVLTVGVREFPPYQVINKDGSMTGFAVETMRDLAKRANLKLTFRAITMDEWRAGPGPERYDLLPQIGITNDRLLRMDFTQPIDESSYSMFVRAGDDKGFTDLDDLTGYRVAVQEVNYARQLAEQQGGLTLEIVEEGKDLVQALLDQRADVALYTSESMRELISETGLDGEIIEIQPPFFVNKRAPALRFGLGDIREQLNTVIPGYLVSDRFRQLQQTWFGEKLFWTRARLTRLIVGGGFIAMVLLGALVWQRWFQQTREADYQREKRKRLRLYKEEQLHGEKLQAMNSELARSNRELDNFAYIASHDLKEPLRGIAINAHLLMREKVSESGIQRIDRMIVLTTRMEQLISDLLFFSRLGRGDVSQEDIDPNEVITSIEQDLLETLDLASGTIVIETQLPLVHADNNKINIVFRNLIANALKYNNSQKKRVTIGFHATVAVDGKHLKNVFYVQDNGIGIDKKNYDKVFRIFTRLNRERDYGPGTGAGLSFVSKIIEEYGNVLTISSRLGQGTTFYFSLPQAVNSQSVNITNQC